MVQVQKITLVAYALHDGECSVIKSASNPVLPCMCCWVFPAAVEGLGSRLYVNIFCRLIRYLCLIPVGVAREESDLNADQKLQQIQ